MTVNTDITNSSYIKKTPLFDFHIAAGAKIVDFAGWALPVYYSSILEEALHVRKKVGLFDVSHMGEIYIYGKDRLKFLQYLTTNNITTLKEKRMQYTLCCDDEGRILDDFMVYNLGNCFLCVTNASNTHTVLMHFLRQSKNFRVSIEDKSKEMSLVCIQGADSEKIISKVFKKRFSGLYYMDCQSFKFNNTEILLSRSGYTGEDGFEIYMDNMTSRIVWEKILSEEPDIVKPCGLGARDILRLEMGYTLYGTDINNTTNPVSGSLMWVVKNKKNFLGKEKIMQLKENGVPFKKIGFIMVEKGFARNGYKIFSKNNTHIGEVKSGLYSPNVDAFIGTASIASNECHLNNEILIEIRQKKIKAKVTQFPLIQPKTKKRRTLPWKKKV
jgi:aminomethyltransferase